jgi:hypothetical protein
MRRAINRCAALTVVLLASTAVSAVAAGPAMAATAACSATSINPRSPIPGLAVDKAFQERAGTLAGRTLKLLAGTRDFDSRQYGWAEISGPTQGSDTVSLQISQFGRNINKPITTCGPFSVDVARSTGFTRGERTSNSASVAFRACGRLATGASSCTSWW